MIRTVVVGAGAAGAPLATRLSEDPERTVMLIEAGSAELPTAAELLDGSALPAAVPGHPANWGFEAELAPGLFTTVPRGKVLGGSSTINGGYFVRPRSADFVRWSRAGGPGWSRDEALPLLATLENDLDFPSAPGHGDAGPMRVRRPSLAGELSSAFVRAAEELGFPDEPDKNAIDSSPGIGPVPSNVVDGIRANTAMRYLLDARNRPNLTVRGDTRVLRVLISDGRVLGVEVASPVSRTTELIEADEVVLCAGAVCSAQLLLLSGIGPKDDLDALGVPVAADLPVGDGFRDHPNLALLWRPAHPLLDPEERFVFPAALSFDSAGAPGAHEQGDLEILLSVKPESALFGEPSPPEPSAIDGHPGTAEDPTVLRLIVALQQSRSRGRLSLRSADPLAPPRIEYRYLEDADDRRRLRSGVRTAARLLRTRAFERLFAGFVTLDDETLASNDRLDAWVRAHLGTAIHMCGTAPMGSVVDGAGRVHGVSGLRVADTSILPDAPSRGPFATAVFIGELIARRMLEHR